MIFPQVIKLVSFTPGDDVKDTKLVFPGEAVLNDGTQAELGAGDAETVINIDIAFYDMTSGAQTAVAGKNINFFSASNVWSLDIDVDVINALPDRHKFVGLVTKNAGEAINMRSFRLPDFSVDNGSFEQMIARLPFEIVIGTPTEMRWYETTAGFGGGGGPVLFKAELYQGSAGTTAATSADKVTHRGPIVEGP